MKVRLTIALNERDCARRNALSHKPPALALSQGTIGTLVDTFDNGDSFMVEFGRNGADQCDWLGILSSTEIELVPDIAQAA